MFPPRKLDPLFLASKRLKALWSSEVLLPHQPGFARSLFFLHQDETGNTLSRKATTANRAFVELSLYVELRLCAPLPSILCFRSSKHQIFGISSSQICIGVHVERTKDKL
jgi:hypothetical protein